jgi:hypothetical protein
MSTRCRRPSTSRLLRASTPFPTARPFPAAPYFVFLSRAGRRAVVAVWPIALEQPLPLVQIPLLPGGPDVLLDPQRDLHPVCDIIGYDDLINHSRFPTGPLPPTHLTWAEEQLQRAGRRP